MAIEGSGKASAGATAIYDITYALAARNGRHETLFGPYAEQAHEAFCHSVPANTFPELWFEMPLVGEPWFDLHALTAREDLEPGQSFDPGESGGYPEVFSWFAAQEPGIVRQLALSWDSSKNAERPAVQLLVGTSDPTVTCDFLAAAGREDAVASYRAFRERIPDTWFACYTGTFPNRPGMHLRVECTILREQQDAYATDAALLEKHLRQVGLANLGDTLVSRCQELARTPFSLEFQFDVTADGSAGPTMSASVRFAPPSDPDDPEIFSVDGPAGELMQQVEAWGLADARWRQLADTVFAKRISRGQMEQRICCYPAFIKLRWRDGEPVDAKTYLIAGMLWDA